MDLASRDRELVTILDHMDSDTYLLDNRGSKLFLMTNLDAPNQRVVTVDASEPTQDKWLDFIPESSDVLSASVGGGSFFAHYMIGAISRDLFNIDVGDETDERYSVVYGTTPWAFAQIRAGYRQCDSDNPDSLRNYGEGFVQIHGFF